MNNFLLGASAMGAFCIALFFFGFWRKSRDLFHLLFAASFLVLAAQRVLLAALELPNEAFPELYIPRFMAYLLIIFAVAWKNAGGRTIRRGPGDGDNRTGG